MKKNNIIKAKAKVLYGIREFIRILPFHILVMGSVFTIATIFNKYAEAVCFLVAFFTLRYKFDKTYHSDSMVVCMTMTISMFSISVIICLPIYTSLFFSIFLGYLDSYLLWFLRDTKDYKILAKRLQIEINRLLLKISHKNIYAMSQDELYKHCRDCGLSEEECRIAYFVVIERLKGKELYNALGYCDRHCKRIRKKVLNKIDK